LTTFAPFRYAYATLLVRTYISFVKNGVLLVSSPQRHFINKTAQHHQLNLFYIYVVFLYNGLSVKRNQMLELLYKIKEMTDAGIILNHMELFDELEKMMNESQRSV